MKKIAVLGKFDGVHIGHRALLCEALKKRTGDETVAVYTFDPGENDIYAKEYKEYLLGKNGADEIRSFVFADLKETDAEDFVRMLKEDGVTFAVCGFNYTFGKGRTGNAALLKELFGGNASVVAEVKTELSGKEVTVSSTLIRDLLSDGKIKEANTLLGSPYCIESEVIPGKKIGRTLGFPTVNQKINCRGLKKGVYSSVTEYGGFRYASVTNVGICPTFGSEELHSETNIIGFEGNLYGKRPKVFLTDFIRNEQIFENPEELMKMIGEDIKISVKKHPVENF